MPRSRADIEADKALASRPPRTFDEAFAEMNLTSEERTALVWHLATMRARNTIEALLPGPPEGTMAESWMLGILRNGDASDAS